MKLNSNDLLRELLEQAEIINIKEYEDDIDCFRINISEPNINDFISTLKEEIKDEIMDIMEEMKDYIREKINYGYDD